MGVKNRTNNVLEIDYESMQVVAKFRDYRHNERNANGAFKCRKGKHNPTGVKRKLVEVVK